MTATINIQVQEQVEIVTEAKIMNRIDKLTATSEKALYNALAPLPKSVVATSLKNLAATGQLRRVNTPYGIQIARKTTTNDQIKEAIKRTLTTIKKSETKKQFAEPAWVAKDDLHYSETAEFGDSRS